MTFTSSSTVRFLLESGGAAAGRRAHRLDRPGHHRDRARSTASTVDVEAERHDIDGLVDALTADAARRRVPA